MKRIQLHIKNNETRSLFRCTLTQNAAGWHGLLQQEDFQYQFIQHGSLLEAIETLSQYLEPMHDLTIFGEHEDDALYVALLNGYIRILRSNKFLDRKQG
jgi:hypothetical protein